MWAAIERAERRTCVRFPDERPHSIRCDPHAYRRLLRSDLRQARRQCPGLAGWPFGHGRRKQAPGVRKRAEEVLCPSASGSARTPDPLEGMS
jgi:hypothetical protein